MYGMLWVEIYGAEAEKETEWTNVFGNPKPGQSCGMPGLERQLLGL